MEILETVEVAADRNLTDLRFPVQYVNRPNLNFRGFAGTLAVLGVLCATLDNRMRILATTLAGGVAVLAWNLPLKLNLVAAIVVSVAVCLALEYTVLRRSSDERDARTEARR